eukprot:GFYU01000394.1.p1 GENE.GFYU01000394.1~~GFYU01000394.1.p1  ORF type:complete len:171 (+),score=64.75 GFYU01000394.1:58-513(+)
MSRNVAIAVDSSECSHEAFDWAVKNVLRAGDHVTLVHVHNHKDVSLSSVLGAPLGGHAAVDKAEEAVTKAQQAIEVMFEKYTIELGHLNYTSDTLLKDGDPRKAIVDALVEKKSAFIVMGSRGLGKVAGMIGSVSQHVLIHAPCPVMVYRK